MAISIQYWVNYTREYKKLESKSENAVQCNRVLKFLFDADSKIIVGNVQASMRDRSYRVDVSTSLQK
jgi:hypothetical protein